MVVGVTTPGSPAMRSALLLLLVASTASGELITGAIRESKERLRSLQRGLRQFRIADGIDYELVGGNGVLGS